MDEAIQRARAAREVVADFYAANPRVHIVVADGVAYDTDGVRVWVNLALPSQTPPPEPPAGHAPPGRPAPP